MVSLPRFLHVSKTSDNDPSPSIPRAATDNSANDMFRQGSNSSPPMLGTPGSLKTVFGSSNPPDSSLADVYIDEALPEYLQSSLLASNATMARRSRLDESAGEGLRRNVLVRNAMLSSLERERRQMSEDIPTVAPAVVAAQHAESTSTIDEEAQFFEDLLSELSGPDGLQPTNHVPEASAQGLSPYALILDSPAQADEEEDFVELDSNLPSEPLLTHLIKSPYTEPIIQPPAAAPIAERAAPGLVGSCSSAFSVPLGCNDSGFAEGTSASASAASCCIGYPNVCPYPAMGSFVGGSSEELPALIDDNDSDLDDDEDDVDAQPDVSPEIAHGTEGAEGDAALSRPLSPVLSPVHSMCGDYTSFRDPLSPEVSRPTSPISSASSKGETDGTSPLLLPSDIGPLPSLAELSLQLPMAPGANLLTPPLRSLAPRCDHKHESMASTSSNAERMQWTISSVLNSRPTPVASSSTTPTPTFQSRISASADPNRGGYPFVFANDPSEHSIVVHWSR